MSALPAQSAIDLYREHLADFQEIEDFMGEIAELVSHVADALSHHPNEIDLSPGAAPGLNMLSVDEHDWPSFARLRSMLQTWRVKHDALISAWNRLNERERAEAGPLPPFNAPDPSRAVV